MKKTKILLIFIIALFFEVIIFNITSYRTLFGNYEKKVYENPEFLYNNEDEYCSYLKVDNINTEVVTFKIEFYDNTELADYSLFYSDETSTEFQHLSSKQYISNFEKSKYMPIYLSGKTDGLLIKINTNVYETGELKRVILNEKIPFEFNIIRFGIIVLISFFAYFMKNGNLFNSDYSPKNLQQEMVLLLVLGIFLFLVSIINNYSSGERETYDINEHLSIDRGIYNIEFVNSLVEGKLYLTEGPTEKFLNLENPYDAHARYGVIRDVDYKWDTAYYNEHFYIYFGILPVLIAFLPYHLITNSYLKISIVVFSFSILIFILLKEILLKILSRYFDKIPFKIVIYFLITLCSGALILYANGMSRVYELVIIAGLYFVLQGIYFILKSLENDKNKHLNIFLGSLCLALSVACRPTDLLASILILPYLISLLIKYIKEFKENKSNLFKLLVSVGIPYISVGLALMYYNYIRFENVFDFGSKYQITINNMMTLGSRIFAIPTGIICNFFKIPNFIPDFPFITHSNDLMTFYGYYYIENMIGGVFMIAPICFAIFYIVKFNKKEENRELKIIVNTLVIVAILIAVISIMMAGSNQRYLIDYAWMLVLAGILIFVNVYCTLKSDESKKIFQVILSIITIYTFLISISAGIISEKDYMKNNSPEEYYKTKYTVCFWE